MRSYQTILVATDLRVKDDDPVVAKAKSLATESGGKLTLVHVIEPIQYPYGTPHVSTNLKNWQNELLQITKDKFERLGKSLNLDDSKRVLTQGKAKEQIIDVAKSIKADLIIIGAHTEVGKDFLMLGSVADYVLQHAPCDVLTVKL